MDRLLTGQGYRRARCVQVWVRATGFVTCRFVWRHRSLGLTSTLTLASRAFSQPVALPLALRSGAVAT
jgi:hypothetical protein